MVKIPESAVDHPRVDIKFCVFERLILLPENKKKSRDREKNEKCHARSMTCGEADKAFILNAHHVPLRQNVVEIRLQTESSIGGARCLFVMFIMNRESES